MATVICAWCPTFDPKAHAAGVSHGICPACRERVIHDLMKLPTRPGVAPVVVVVEASDVE